MSVAYYIVLDNKEPGFDPFVNGKVVAHAAEDLEKVAALAGIQPLESFMGQSSEELMDMLSVDFDDDEYEDNEDCEERYSDKKWFKPSDGIALIDALAKVVRQNPQIISNPDEIIEDLEEYRDVLQKAESIKAKWHFAIDF